MTTESQEAGRQLPWHSAIFTAGLLLWSLSCLLLLFWLDLFTEAMLTPWYCCDMADMPPVGTWGRTVNDFFAATPGRILPALAFFVIEGLIFRARWKRTGERTWQPMLFFVANIILFLVSIVVTNLSWGVSNQVASPRVGGIDAGYHRTWYGIVAHMALWSLFFVTLAKIHLPHASRGN